MKISNFIIDLFQPCQDREVMKKGINFDGLGIYTKGNISVTFKE